MLEPTRPFGAPVRAFVAAFVTFDAAREAWEREAYWAMRHAIFCDETGLFASAGAERDSHDSVAIPIVAIAHSAGTPADVVGIVRIFEDAPGIWYGGRLGVLEQYRARVSVGAGLIKAAVGSAKARGCKRFLATVLLANVAYFKRNHFKPIGTSDVCGRPHMLMQADLQAFAPVGFAARDLGCAA
jgi:putative N-acetyltransferase (TIGR04045 family)